MAPIRALGLLSGGLDSTLAAKLLLEQGVDVVGLHLESPTACRTDVHAVAGELGIPLVVRSKGEEYVRLLRQPRYGYGRNMNPCIDCRIFMFQLARPCLDEYGAHFVFTGEVLGQRPMSQTRGSLELVERRSGLTGFIVRPLSALNLPETEPERRGWVDRSRLLGIEGRSREVQLRLARERGITAYHPPGGGCLLTDPGFARRLRDLFDHAPGAETGLEEVALLRLGRHIRVAPDLTIVLGRNAAENERLRSFESQRRWLVEPDGFPGPSALVCGTDPARGLQAAADLITRYGGVPAEAAVRCRQGSPAGPSAARPQPGFTR